jgi:hypothetical protein
MLSSSPSKSTIVTHHHFIIQVPRAVSLSIRLGTMAAMASYQERELKQQKVSNLGIFEPL